MREGRAEGGAKVGMHICVEYSIMFSLAHRERKGRVCLHGTAGDCILILSLEAFHLCQYCFVFARTDESLVQCL